MLLKLNMVKELLSRKSRVQFIQFKEEEMKHLNQMNIIEKIDI